MHLVSLVLGTAANSKRSERGTCWSRPDAVDHNSRVLCWLSKLFQSAAPLVLHHPWHVHSPYPPNIERTQHASEGTVSKRKEKKHPQFAFETLADRSMHVLCPGFVQLIWDAANKGNVEFKLPEGCSVRVGDELCLTGELDGRSSGRLVRVLSIELWGHERLIKAVTMD
jgi:hypothetical protein